MTAQFITQNAKICEIEISFSGNRISRKFGGKKAVRSLFLLLLIATVPISTFAQDPNSAPLIMKGDLVYEGGFRVPGGGNEPNTFNYGGRSIAYNSANNSLFIIGHEHHQRTAEISIPAIVNSSKIGDLKTATLLQPFRDATEGKLHDINPKNSESQIIGGQLVYNGKLVLSGFSSYDASGTQQSSHFSRPLSLSSTGQSQGPHPVGNAVHLTSAYMTHIPSEWQGALGGPALTGNCCRSIIGFQSHGPAISVFEPNDIGRVNPVKATGVLKYTSANPLGPGGTKQNPYWNLKTRVNGVVFPNGTRSVLFFGEHGLGEYCYGESSACGDPADGDKGSHTFPYKYQVWAYDAKDFVAAKNGKKRLYDVQPYSVWNFDMPFVGNNSRHDLNGAAYDAGRGRIFLVQPNGESSKLPVIHVFSIKQTIRPASPGSFVAQ